MATYEQLPGRLGLAFRKGDSVSTEIDFSPTSFVGQTVSATIYSVVSGNVVQAMTSTLVNAAEGRVNVSLSRSQSAGLASGTYSWDLVATDGTAARTYITGLVEVS
jgi:hypothetical protein